MKKDQIVMVRRKQYHNTIRTKFDYKLANIITTNLNNKKNNMAIFQQKDCNANVI